MNLFERWFAELSTKWLKRGAHRSVAELTAAVEHWVADWSANPRPFVWHKTADQLFDNLAGYLNRVPDSGSYDYGSLVANRLGALTLISFPGGASLLRLDRWLHMRGGRFPPLPERLRPPHDAET